ncbi:unnamed protein product [Moneuplotes crassus]|uniref:Uncharacterized protein n=1 Tax=Euplotes crassus TaxID=5936 RepID=A0AAD1Y7N1_EUPCR|nr:unnamed protein product [Moneuplotes crassus]
MSNGLQETRELKRARDLTRLYDETFIGFKLRVKNEIDKINKFYMKSSGPEETTVFVPKVSGNRRLSASNKSFQLTDSVSPVVHKDMKTTTKTRQGLMAFNGEVSSIICDNKKGNNLQEDLFTYNEIQEKEMTKNELLYIEEVKKVRDKLSEPQEKKCTRETQEEKERAASRFRLQALCNDNSAFQKYKKGTLFEDKVDIMELVREGKAEQNFKKRNKSVIGPMESTDPQSIREQEANTFRNTMERLRNLSMDPNVSKPQRERSHNFKPHYIKVLPPNTPQNFRKIRREVPVIRNFRSNKFPGLSKVKSPAQKKLNTTLSTIGNEEATGSTTKREILIPPMNFDNADIQHNHSSFLITENKQSDSPLKKQGKKSAKKYKLSKINLP